jgi:hypothetical protein
MDLNQAFAKHWDKKNPTDFVQSCDHSRQLREDYIANQEQKERFLRACEQYNATRNAGANTGVEKEKPAADK